MGRNVAHKLRTLEKSTPTLLTGIVYISSMILLDVPNKGIFVPKSFITIVTMKRLIFCVSKFMLSQMIWPGECAPTIFTLINLQFLFLITRVRIITVLPEINKKYDMFKRSILLGEQGPCQIAKSTYVLDPSIPLWRSNSSSERLPGHLYSLSSKLMLFSWLSLFFNCSLFFWSTRKSGGWRDLVFLFLRLPECDLFGGLTESWNISKHCSWCSWLGMWKDYRLELPPASQGNLNLALELKTLQQCHWHWLHFDSSAGLHEIRYQAFEPLHHFHSTLSFLVALFEPVRKFRRGRKKITEL